MATTVLASIGDHGALERIVVPQGCRRCGLTGI